MNTAVTICLLYGLLGPASEPPDVPPPPPDLAPENTPGAVDAAGPIAVEVASGRTFTGQCDPRTDETQLWLRRQQGSAAVLRPIRWDRVVRAHVAGAELSGEEFLGLIKRLRREAPVRAEAVAGQKSIVIKGAAEPTAAPAPAGLAAQALPEAPQVRSLAIEAGIANWDANVEVDGLVVRIFPLDATGALVPVRGTLEVELIGRRTGATRLPQPFERIGQWAQAVRLEDFGPNGAVYRLPFQGVHPEFDLTVASRGAVHARLSVPGGGTFEATASTVRIRPYSAVRDQLQQINAQRFFPQEATGDGRH